MREIELVHSAVDWVYFNRGPNVESGLLEAETHPPRAGEEVNGDWSHIPLPIVRSRYILYCSFERT
jgi:hypothetical protein